MAGILSRVGDSEIAVRVAALEVLGRFPETGDTAAIGRLLGCLEDRDQRVRLAATESLGRVAVKGDSRVLAALIRRLEDEVDSVRRAAATSLGQVTVAPSQELEEQDRRIAELESRCKEEVEKRDHHITA